MNKLFDQAKESMWGMPRYTEARKAVVSCDKPVGSCTQAMIPGLPNGETRLSVMAVTLYGVSKPRELKHLSTSRKEKSTEMP